MKTLLTAIALSFYAVPLMAQSNTCPDACGPDFGYNTCQGYSDALAERLCNDHTIGWWQKHPNGTVAQCLHDCQTLCDCCT